MTTKKNIEEVALSIIPDKSTKGWIDSFSATERIGFVKGYNFAQQQKKNLYSEERINLLHKSILIHLNDKEAEVIINKLFEQFKNKQ